MAQHHFVHPSHFVRGSLRGRAARICFLALVSIGVGGLSSCRTESGAWSRARGENSEKALTAFMAEYPDSVHVLEARDAIVTLHWDEARKANTIDACQLFLANHPEGPRAVEARMALQEMRWTAAKGGEDLPALQEFVRRYPASVHRPEADRLIDDLQWKRASAEENLAALEQFLRDASGSRHEDEARRMMEALKEREWEETSRSEERRPYLLFLEKYPASKHAGAAKEKIEEIDWHKVQQERSVSSYREYDHLHPDSPRTKDERSEVEREIWKRVSGGGKRSDLVDFLQDLPGSPFAPEAAREMERLDWETAQAQGSAAAYQAFLTAYPKSQLAAQAKARVEADKDFWKIDARRLCRASMEMKDWGSGVSIGFGSYIVAEYHREKDSLPDNGLHVTTTFWSADKLNKATRDSEWNDNVLAVQDEGRTIYKEPFCVLVEIERRESPGLELLDFSCAEILLADGSRVHPCGIFLADVDEKVTGKLQGCLFKGYIRLPERKFDAIQSGPPYPGRVKLSLPERKVMSAFEFQPGGRMTLGLLFQKVLGEEDIKEFTMWGKKISLPVAR